MADVNKLQWGDISDWLSWWLSEPRLSKNSQETLDRYYGSYRRTFTDYLKKQYSSQTKEILAQISKGSRLLEVGCGCGTEAIWFAMLGASIVGIDLNEARIEVARERKRYVINKINDNVDIELQLVNIFELQYADEFDLIWMEQTFHHLEPRREVPAKLYKLLKPGGAVVISEANGWNPALQLTLICSGST